MAKSKWKGTIMYCEIGIKILIAAVYSLLSRFIQTLKRPKALADPAID